MARLSATYLIPGFFSFSLLVCCLFACTIEPRIGTADNGEYSSLMATIGVKHSSENWRDIYYTHFRQNYLKDDKATLQQRVNNSLTRFPASLFTTASLFINSAVQNTRKYDIMYLGIIYSVAYSLAFFFFLTSLTRNMNPYCQFLLALVAGLIFADPLFITYFNSFYQEPAFIIMFLICLGLLVRKSDSVLTELSIFCVSMSRVSNAIFTVLYLLPALSHTRRNRVILLMVFLSAALMLYGSGTNRQSNIFNSFFNGMLRENPEKDRIFADFRLRSQDYAGYIGKDYWGTFDENSAGKEIRKEFYSKVNMTEIVFYYARHPNLLISRFNLSLKHIKTYGPRPLNLGNYSREYFSGKQSYSGIALFSTTMTFLVFLVPIIAALCMVISLFGRRLWEFFLLLVLFATLPCVIVVSFLSDGFTGFAKHLFPFYSVLAVMLVVSLGGLLKFLPAAEAHHSE